MYFLGPGDYKLEDCLPPGTKCVQCEHAPSGHLNAEEKRGGLEIEKEVALPVKEQA